MRAKLATMKMMSVYMKQKMIDDLRKVSENEGVTSSGMVRMLVADKIKKEKRRSENES